MILLRLEYIYFLNVRGALLIGDNIAIRSDVFISRCIYGRHVQRMLGKLVSRDRYIPKCRVCLAFSSLERWRKQETCNRPLWCCLWMKTGCYSSCCEVGEAVVMSGYCIVTYIYVLILIPIKAREVAAPPFYLYSCTLIIATSSQGVSSGGVRGRKYQDIG